MKNLVISPRQGHRGATVASKPNPKQSTYRAQQALADFHQKGRSHQQAWTRLNATPLQPAALPSQGENSVAIRLSQETRAIDGLYFPLAIADDAWCPLILANQHEQLCKPLTQALRWLLSKQCAPEKVKGPLQGENGALWRSSCAFLMMRIVEARATLGHVQENPHVRSQCDKLALWFNNLLLAGMSALHKAQVATATGQRRITISAAASWHADMELLRLIAASSPHSYGPAMAHEAASARVESAESTYFLAAEKQALDDNVDLLAARDKCLGFSDAMMLAVANHLSREQRLALANHWFDYLKDPKEGTSAETGVLLLGNFVASLFVGVATENHATSNEIGLELLTKLASLPGGHRGMAVAMMAVVGTQDVALFAQAAPLYRQAVASRDASKDRRPPSRLRQLIALSGLHLARGSKAGYLVAMADVAHQLGEAAYPLSVLGASVSEALKVTHFGTHNWAIPISAHAMRFGLPALAKAYSAQEQAAARQRRELEESFWNKMQNCITQWKKTVATQSFWQAWPEILRLSSLHAQLIGEEGWITPEAADAEHQGITELIDAIFDITSDFEEAAGDDKAERQRKHTQQATLRIEALAQAIDLAAQDAKKASRARKQGQCWVARVRLDLPSVLCARGTLQYLVASGFQGDILPVLAGDDGARPYDFVQAYATANAYAEKGRTKNGKPQRSNVQQQLERAAPTAEIVLQMLIVALGSEDALGVEQLLQTAKNKQLVFDALRGPALAQLATLLAKADKTLFQAVLRLFTKSASQAVLFAEPDEAGDTLYHKAARGLSYSPGLLAFLLEKSRCSAERLATMTNVAGRTPLQEAACAAADAELLYLWRKRGTWQVTAPLAEALYVAATTGQWGGLRALLTAAVGDRALRQWCLSLPAAFAQLGAPARMQKRVRAVLATPPGAALEEEFNKTGAPAGADAAVHVQRVEHEADPIAPIWRLIEKEDDDAAGFGAWLQVSGKGLLATPAPWAAAAHALRASRSDAERHDGLQQMATCFAALANVPDFASIRHDALRTQMNRAAWRAIVWLDTRFYGQYFGCHFCAHRPEVTRDALRARLFAWRNYGSWRFDEGDGVNILMLRQNAYQAMREKKDLYPGRYTVDLTLATLRGCGYILDKMDAEPRYYQQSRFARAVFDVAAAGRTRLVSLYPIPEDAARLALLATPQPSR